MHTFELELCWNGSTAVKNFVHEGQACASNKPSIPVSTAPPFGGAATHWNPDELFGAALALCHQQTFLSLASKIRVDVHSYEDRVEVELDTIDGVTRITRVALRPTITISADSDADKAEKFFHKAHKYCFVANSFTGEVLLEPTFVVEKALATS